MTFGTSDWTLFLLHVAPLAQGMICLGKVHRVLCLRQVTFGTLFVFRGGILYLLAVLVDVVASRAIFYPGFGVMLIVIKRNGGTGEMPKSAVIDLFDIFLGKAGKSGHNDGSHGCGQASKSKSPLHRYPPTPDRVFP